jgi:hypothetical protein
MIKIKIALLFIYFFIVGCDNSLKIDWLIPANISTSQTRNLKYLGFSKLNVDVPLYEIEIDEGKYAIQFSDFDNRIVLYHFWEPNKSFSNFSELKKYLEFNKLTVLSSCDVSSDVVYVIHNDLRIIYKVIIEYNRQVIFVYETPRVKLNFGGDQQALLHGWRENCLQDVCRLPPTRYGASTH